MPILIFPRDFLDTRSCRYFKTKQSPSQTISFTNEETSFTKEVAD